MTQILGEYMRTTSCWLASASLIALGLAACSGPSEVPVEPQAAAMPSRAGLAAGLHDAESVAWNIELLASHPSPPGFFEPDALWSPPVPIAAEPEETDNETGAEAVPADDEEAEAATSPPSPISFANTDLAFTGDRLIMGNFHGFNVFDVSVPAAPEVILSLVCPGGQGDVSVHGNLVFHSVEQGRARLDCGAGGVEGESSADRFRGVRIFDISDLANPRQVAAVQTCRGSHTHTLVPHPTDAETVYIYVQGTGGVRPDTELAGCVDGEPEDNPDTALYSIDIIEVPLGAPEQAAIINRPHIFADAETGEIAGLWRGGASEEGAQQTSSTVACHDITAYPHMNLAAGACGGNGILLDISDPANPTRIADVFDPNMAYWHSATFSNDASRVIFTDEWGGGLGARCRAEDPENWGANIVVDITPDGLVRRGYFKIPGEQSDVENCVAHNGSLVPVPGRDIMVQGWYSGGLSVIDFTNPDAPFELAFFDRGPIDADQLYLAGYWAAYWHNGYIWAPEIARGLDVLQLQPSPFLSENEIAAARLIRFEEENTQTQQHFVWPAEPVVALAYLDQLARSEALSADSLSAARAQLEAWRSGTAELEDLRLMGRHFSQLSEAAQDTDAARMAALGALLQSFD